MVDSSQRFLALGLSSWCLTWNPISRFGFSGGDISRRMASNTTLNCASYFFSIAASLRASSALEASICRSFTNARTVKAKRGIWMNSCSSFNGNEFRVAVKMSRIVFHQSSDYGEEKVNLLNLNVLNIALGKFFVLSIIFPQLSKTAG